jgi:hypothetical protein
VLTDDSNSRRNLLMAEIRALRMQAIALLPGPTILLAFVGLESLSGRLGAMAELPARAVDLTLLSLAVTLASLGMAAARVPVAAPEHVLGDVWRESARSFGIGVIRLAIALGSIVFVVVAQVVGAMSAGAIAALAFVAAWACLWI